MNSINERYSIYFFTRDFDGIRYSGFTSINSLLEGFVTFMTDLEEIDDFIDLFDGLAVHDVKAFEYVHDSGIGLLADYPNSTIFKEHQSDPYENGYKMPTDDLKEIFKLWKSYLIYR